MGPAKTTERGDGDDGENGRCRGGGGGVQQVEIGCFGCRGVVGRFDSCLG